MDTDRNQSGDYERDWLESDRRARVQSQSPREQPHNPVLRGNSGDYDYKYPPRYYDEFHAALHHYNAPHHHGPGVYDILIHDHDQFPDHDHIVKLYDDNIGHNHEYGAADHQHDQPNINPTLDKPYAYDNRGNIIDTPSHRP